MSTRSRQSLLTNQLGVSLIELMIAMLIGLLLLGGLIQIYLSGKQSYNAQEQLARIQEGGRFGMDLITRDLRRSGYWGGSVDMNSIAGPVGFEAGWANPGAVAPAHSCVADNTWGRMVRWRVSGLNNTNAGYDCATGYLPDTDILALRYAGPEIVTGTLQDGGLYLRSTMFLGRVMTGDQAGHPDNQMPPDPTFAPEHLLPQVRSLVSNAYYVGDSGRTCPGGQPIPALMRVSLNPVDGRPNVQEIASGVEQLQVRYLLGNAYVDADQVLAGDWPDVSAVRVWMLVRGDCPEPGLENQTTYVMGDTTVDVDDNFRRQLYVSTVMLRNFAVR
jgi:type IV pilus assembly protein PilW